MKRLISPIPLLLLVLFTHAQVLNQVNFSGGSSLSSFSFTTDQGLIIQISDEGKVLAWGTPWETQRYGYYPGKLLPYMGRVDYYGNEYDSALKGKIRSIGTCFLSYYGSSDIATNTGKLRSVGNVSLEYYSSYENTAFRGKLQFAGSVLFSYYSSSENEAYRGKLRSVGNTPITYYSTFDDKNIQGKIKSIGPVPYTWYSTNKGRIYQDPLNYSSPLTQTINGITYIAGY